MKEYKLGDIVTFHYGKSLPETKRINGLFPVMSSAGITGWHNESLVKGPGVIVGRKGSIGTVFYENRDFFPIDTCYFLTVNDQRIVDLKFLYYLLLGSNLKDLNSDAAVPGLNREIAYSQKFLIPELSVQTKIVKFTDTYNDLIEKNKRRITILEDIAQSLYREWFVKFCYPNHQDNVDADGKPKRIDSPLGQIPEGWEVKTLKNVLELAYGKALKQADRKGGDVAVYGSGGLGGYHDDSLVDGPCIIVGRKGNVGKIFWVDQDCWPIDTVFYVKSEFSKFYLYYNLLHQTFFNSDAAVPGLNRESAYNNKIIIPSSDLVAKFDDFIRVIFKQKLCIVKANDNLKQQRDMLLPKLLSGQIKL